MVGALKLSTIAALAVVASLGCARAESPAEETVPGDELYLGFDAADLEFARAAIQQALETRPSGSTQRWASETSGNGGEITPLATFRTSTGYFCRRFRETVVSRRAGEASGQRTACRGDDGVWQRVRF